MGWRIRKSKKFGPFRITASKSGVSWSWGFGPFRRTINSRGRTTNTVRIPGTGISHSTSSSGGRAGDSGSPDAAVSAWGCIGVAVACLFVIGACNAVLFPNKSPEQSNPATAIAKDSPKPARNKPKVEAAVAVVPLAALPPVEKPPTAEQPAPEIESTIETADRPLRIREPRVWTDTKKRQVTAILLDRVGDSVYLKKNDGKTIIVLLEKLSGEDQEYVAEEISAIKTIKGKVVGVTDGDTLTILDGKSQHKIRLEGIDAPEGGQAFGSKAKQRLSDKVFGKQARIEWRTTDRYGRILGNVIVGGHWINKELVDEGYSWHFKKYSDSVVLAEAENNARKQKLGLWGDSGPFAPWEFRKNSEVARGPPPEKLRPAAVPLPLPAHTPPVYAPEPYVAPYRSGDVHVKGYYRKDGTYVKPHSRKPPRK